MAKKKIANLDDDYCTILLEPRINNFLAVTYYLVSNLLCKYS